jgi:TonB family protein
MNNVKSIYKYTFLLFILFLFRNTFAQAASDNFKKAEQFYSTKQYGEAIKFLNLALIENPTDSKTLFMRGRCNLETEMYYKALDDFNSASNLLPQESFYMYYRSICEWKLNRQKASVTNLEKSLEYDPYNFMSHFLLGAIYLDMNSNEKARHHFLQAKEEGDRFGFKLADHKETKYYDEYLFASNMMTKEIKKNPKIAKSHLLAGMLKTMIKDNYGAIDDYTKTLELDPNITLGYYFRGITYMYTKRFKDALEDLFRYSEANPKDEKANALLNEVKEKMNADMVLDVNTDEVYMVTDIMPEFPGGEVAMKKFVAQNLVYPKMAMSDGIKGRVIVSFVIAKDGKILDSKVMRGIGKECDNEALRIVNTMPKWKPGQHNGKPASVRFTMPIMFSIIE